MLARSSYVLLAAAAALPLPAQIWIETGAGELPGTAEATLGSGALTQIVGSLDAAEIADLYVIHVDDPASFTCSTVNGATWDTQLWMFDPQGFGISFRDDDVGTLRSTLTGQFLAGPGTVIIGVSQYNNDALDAGAMALWLNTPFNVERQPDGPGAANAFTQWSGAPTATAGAYTITLSGASFAGPLAIDEAAVAWAWVNVSGSTPSFTPSIYYQHTPSGEVITAERTAQGQFAIDFGSMPYTGALHATAYGGNHTAVVEYWNNSTGTLVGHVNVFDTAGNPVDASFSVHYRVGGAPTDRAAYVWADSPSSPSYTPSALYRFNGNRPAPTITRSSVGVYQVTLPGLSTSGASEGGNVQVTPYTGFGTLALTRAKVSSWGTSGGDLVVNVRTFDGVGTPSDEYFVMSYHEAAAPIPEHLGSGAHVWANNPTSASYTPSSFYTDSNGTVGPPNSETVNRISTGVYDVLLPNVIPLSSSIAMATAYGSSSDYASIVYWQSGPVTGTRVRVQTYDSAGVAADSVFSLLYLTTDPAGTPATNTVIGAGCSGIVLTPDSRPVLASNWDLSLVDLPPTSVIGFVSVGVVNPGFPLDGLGAPGCTLYQNLVGISTVPLPAATPSYSLPIPNSSGLIGFQVYAQGAALATGINALDVVTSNAVLGTVGDV